MYHTYRDRNKSVENCILLTLKLGTIHLMHIDTDVDINVYNLEKLFSSDIQVQDKNDGKIIAPTLQDKNYIRFMLLFT